MQSLWAIYKPLLQFSKNLVLEKKATLPNFRKTLFFETMILFRQFLIFLIFPNINGKVYYLFTEVSPHEVLPIE